MEVVRVSFDYLHMTDVSVSFPVDQEPVMMRDGSYRALVDLFARIHNPFASAFINADQLANWFNSGIRNSNAGEEFSLNLDTGLTFVRATKKYLGPKHLDGTGHWLNSYERKRQQHELDLKRLHKYEDQLSRESKVLRNLDAPVHLGEEDAIRVSAEGKGPQRKSRDLPLSAKAAYLTIFLVFIGALLIGGIVLTKNYYKSWFSSSTIKLQEPNQDLFVGVAKKILQQSEEVGGGVRNRSTHTRSGIYDSEMGNAVKVRTNRLGRSRPRSRIGSDLNATTGLEERRTSTGRTKSKVAQVDPVHRRISRRSVDYQLAKMAPGSDEEFTLAKVAEERRSSMVHLETHAEVHDLDPKSKSLPKEFREKVSMDPQSEERQNDALIYESIDDLALQRVAQERGLTLAPIYSQAKKAKGRSGKKLRQRREGASSMSPEDANIPKDDAQIYESVDNVASGPIGQEEEPAFVVEELKQQTEAARKYEKLYEMEKRKREELLTRQRSATAERARNPSGDSLGTRDLRASLRRRGVLHHILQQKTEKEPQEEETHRRSADDLAMEVIEEQKKEAAAKLGSRADVNKRRGKKGKGKRDARRATQAISYKPAEETVYAQPMQHAAAVPFVSMQNIMQPQPMFTTPTPWMMPAAPMPVYGSMVNLGQLQQPNQPWLAPPPTASMNPTPTPAPRCVTSSSGHDDGGHVNPGFVDED